VGKGSVTTFTRRICADDPEAIDLIDQATQNAPSLHINAFDNVQGIHAPTGNTSQRAVRRLRKDRPDLHAQVLAKAISPHAAMVEAGFRRKTATVPVDDLDALNTIIEERKSAQARAQAPKPLITHGGDRTARPEQGVVNTLNRGSSNADYLTARIARDRPGILERMRAGTGAHNSPCPQRFARFAIMIGTVRGHVWAGCRQGATWATLGGGHPRCGRSPDGAIRGRSRPLRQSTGGAVSGWCRY
jgi:hypothetical protein